MPPPHLCRLASVYRLDPQSSYKAAASLLAPPPHPAALAPPPKRMQCKTHTHTCGFAPTVHPLLPRCCALRLCGHPTPSTSPATTACMSAQMALFRKGLLVPHRPLGSGVAQLGVVAALGWRGARHAGGGGAYRLGVAGGEQAPAVPLPPFALLLQSGPRLAGVQARASSSGGGRPAKQRSSGSVGDVTAPALATRRMRC